MFEIYLQKFANQAELEVVNISCKGATLLFEVDGCGKLIYVIPQRDTWRFSCPSDITFNGIGQISEIILEAVLERNTKTKRGFWAIETIGTKKRLEFIHNVRVKSINPQEMSTICYSALHEVRLLEAIDMQIASIFN